MVESGPSIRLKKDKTIKFKADAEFYYLVNKQAKEAGYLTLAQYLRHLVTERQEIEAFRVAQAKQIAESIRKYGITKAHLREQGIE